MSPLPSGTVTGNILEITGAESGSELVPGAVENAQVILTPNIKINDVITWENDIYRVLPIKVSVGADGGFSVRVLSNDIGLNVTNLQWKAEIRVGPAPLLEFWFDPPADGGTLDLSSVVRIPNSRAVGMIRGAPGPGIDDVQSALSGTGVQFYSEGNPIGSPLALPSATWNSITGKPPTPTSIAALRAVTISYPSISVLGYSAAGDGGGGIFRWDSTDTTSTDDGGTIITPSGALASSGRWKRVPHGSTFNVKDYGADSTGSTGDLGAIITSLAATLHAAGGGTIFVPAGTYKFTTTGTSDSPIVNLVCAGSGLTKFVPAAALGSGSCLDISGITTSQGDYGPKVGGFSIDGTATPSGVGLTYGDLERGHLDDIFIDNYPQGKLLRFINRAVWTERTLITRLTLGNNAKIGWSFEVAGGTESFGYTRALDCALNIDKVAATSTVASVTTTAGSTSATVASGGFPGITTGKSVDGTGLYGGTTVAGVSGNTLTLSIPAKTSGTQTLSFAANNQTGIYVGPGAYLYNGSMNLTANTDGGTAGTNQSPVLFKVDDGGFVEYMDFGIDSESPGGAGKVTALWVGDAATFICWGFTTFGPAPWANTNYVSSTVLALRCSELAHWGFLANPTTPASFHAVTDGSLKMFRGRYYNEAYDRMQISDDGSLYFGNGSGTPDVHVYRFGSAGLGVDSRIRTAEFKSLQSSGTNDSFNSIVSGDAQNRLAINANGKLTWSDGTASPDTNLYRSAADTLKTDDALTVMGLLLSAASATGSAGIRLPHGAAPTSPVNGDMWTTTAGLFARINGVTKTVDAANWVQVSVSGISADTTALTAAITAMTSAGKINGKAETTPNSYARITTPVVIDLGYSNTQDSDTWDVETHEKVRLRLDILPDANLGAALTIKGGFGCELDINVLGGGNRATVTDVTTTNNSTTITSVAAVTGGLKVGAVVEISAAGYSPEGTTEKLFASVRSVNTGANTFVISEKAYATLTNATMTWMDVAVRLEDHVGLKLNIYGKAYDGCLLAADAYDDGAKRIRSMAGGNSINGIGVGKTIFWKGIEALGSMGGIWSNPCTPDYWGFVNDLHADHYEGGVFDQTITPSCYAVFDRCAQLNDMSLSFGDRATEACVKIIDGDMGRFSQIRITGYQAQATVTTTSGSASLTNVVMTNFVTPLPGSLITGPGIPASTFVGTATGNFTTGGTVTMVNSGGSAVNATASASTQPIIAYAEPVGLKLVGVRSIEIDTLETSYCQKGLQIIGGGQNGISVKRHFSLTYEFNALVIQPGTNTEPRIAIKANYHFGREAAVRVLSGMTGGSLRLSGFIDTPNLDSSPAVYAVDCASALFALDVADLTQQPARGGYMAGSINHADPALINNVSRARLADPAVHGVSAGTAVSVTAGVQKQNATDKPIQLFVKIRHQPADGVTTHAQFFLGRTSGETSDLGYDQVQRPTGTPALDVIRWFSFVVPAWWWYTISLSGAGATISGVVSAPLN